MLALKSFRDARPGLPDLLNWGFLVADGVVLCKDGSLLAGWLYEGPDLDASPDSQLNWVSEQMNAALARLSGGWSIWVDANRLPSPTYFDPSHSSFPDPVSQLIEDERRGHFLSLGRHYETEYALLVHYMPPLRSKGRLLNLIYSPGQEGGSAADAILSGFERTITDLEDSLSNVVRTRRMRDFVELDVTGREQTRSHLVNYLNFILTGNELSLNLPHCGFYLDSILGSVDFEPGDTPRVGDSYVAVVSIRGFPEQSVPGILAVLDVMSIPLRYSSRFIFIDQPEAHRQITSIERKWKQRLRGFWADVLKLPAPRVDEDALQMTEQASSALGRTNSGLVGTGYFTPVVTLMAATPEEAIENARAVRREIRKLGFNAEIDTINATEAWLGSLPGHTVPNVRRPPMHTDNLADLLPLTSVWTGRPTNPCPYYPPNSPALLQAATSGAAPFWLNLHSGDIAHTLIFGPTGAGKSTLQAMIMAQALRYPGMTIWAFDKGKSSMPIAKACGGRYYDVTTGGELQFCPLSVLDGDGDVAWAEEYIAVCYELQHGAPPTPLERNAIHQAITRMREIEAGRSLTNFCAQVQSQRVREALQHYTLAGPLGRLLDAEEDNLTDFRLLVFEIEELMELGDKQLIPVLLYLFRRFEKSLRGQPAMLQIAEAWVAFGHRVLREKVREWLKTLRKANCAVVMDTQSLSDAARSGILDVLIESCPTKIFLPNESAANTGTEEFPGPAAYYQMFGLNEPQIEIIRTAVPKRHYYVVTPAGSRLIDLQLRPIALAFAGAGGKDDIAEVNALEAQHGRRWPFELLKRKGITFDDLTDIISLEAAA